MRLAVIGTGYVGLVTGAVFAEKGHHVTCVDIDARKIDRLNRGEIPIYEPGLEEIVHHEMEKHRLEFTTDNAVVADADVTFVAVGTPYSEEAHGFDANVLYSVVGDIGERLAHARRPSVVVIKSTITPDIFGDAELMLHHRLDDAARAYVHLASCPEFLREGSAVADTHRPDRIVIGVRDEAAAKVLVDLHKPFCIRDEGRNILVMDPASATLVKLGSNTHRAGRIALMNELAEVCDIYGGDIASVRLGIGEDTVIGSAFLYAGPGYGGSCFPKDLQALDALGGNDLIGAIHEANERHKHYLARKVQDLFGDRLRAKRVALWGLAFKANTDDVRESPAIVTAQDLLGFGARLRVHDPVAMENARAILGTQGVEYFDDPHDAACADLLVIATEWNEYRAPDLARLATSLTDRVIFDGRNILDPDKVESHGMRYYGMGRNGKGNAFTQP